MCERCKAETSITTMSMFNTQTICMECKDAEAKRPDYKAARGADEAAIRRGDFNFPGIGFKANP